MGAELLDLSGLSVEFYSDRPRRRFEAICQGWLTVNQGEVVGLVGESGCGKSLTGRSLVDLLPATARGTGQVQYRGKTFEVGGSDLQELRGREVGMIFQDPMSSLNPVYSVGDQLNEMIDLFHSGADDPKEEALELLSRVQLGSPEIIYQQYPHQLSGGQQQRVLIALALAAGPRLLVADEPATALDAPLRRNILGLLNELAGEGLGIVLISHDLSLVRDVCDRIMVMYSGFTVEDCEVGDEFSPLHPYSQGLLETASALTKASRNRLPVVRGEVPAPKDRPSGCPFHPRCKLAREKCRCDFPPRTSTTQGYVSCWERRG